MKNLIGWTIVLVLGVINMKSADGKKWRHEALFPFETIKGEFSESSEPSDDWVYISGKDSESLHSDEDSQYKWSSHMPSVTSGVMRKGKLNQKLPNLIYRNRINKNDVPKRHPLPLFRHFGNGDRRRKNGIHKFKKLFTESNSHEQQSQSSDKIPHSLFNSFKKFSPFVSPLNLKFEKQNCSELIEMAERVRGLSARTRRIMKKLCPGHNGNHHRKTKAPKPCPTVSQPSTTPQVTDFVMFEPAVTSKVTSGLDTTRNKMTTSLVTPTTAPPTKSTTSSEVPTSPSSPTTKPVKFINVTTEDMTYTHKQYHSTTETNPTYTPRPYHCMEEPVVDYGYKCSPYENGSLDCTNSPECSEGGYKCLSDLDCRGAQDGYWKCCLNGCKKMMCSRALPAMIM